MIRLPQRSVTRFFIPLIDVLTLLFCIFLVMPLAQSPDEDKAEAERLANEERLRQLQAELARRSRAGSDVPEQLREEIERLKREKTKALQDRLAVRVFEIDGRTGKLSYRDPQRVEVPNQAAAHELIKRDRSALGLGSRELYYLILYPRDPDSSYPTGGQREQYDRWFEGVALGYDIPGAEPEGGNRS